MKALLFLFHRAKRRCLPDLMQKMKDGMKDLASKAEDGMKDLATKREIKWGELLRLRPGVVAAFKPAPEVVLKKKVVVFFHGNGDDIAFVAPSLGYIFGRLGLGFCGVEYPGYGLAAEGTSQGPSESGAYAAAEEVLLHLETAKGIKRKQMVLAGQSIGACVV